MNENAILSFSHYFVYRQAPKKTFAFSFEFLLWRLTNFLPFNKFIQKYGPCKWKKLGIITSNVFQTPSFEEGSNYWSRKHLCQYYGKILRLVQTFQSKVKKCTKTLYDVMEKRFLIPDRWSELNGKHKNNLINLANQNK